MDNLRLQEQEGCYLCDAEKNTECRKTGCAFEGRGECYSTKNPAFAWRGKSGKLIITCRRIMMDKKIIGQDVRQVIGDIACATRQRKENSTD